MSLTIFEVIRLVFFNSFFLKFCLRLVCSCRPRLICSLLSIIFFVGRPQRANLLCLAVLCLLDTAVGCTRIFRVPATLGICLLKYVCKSADKCGTSRVWFQGINCAYTLEKPFETSYILHIKLFYPLFNITYKLRTCSWISSFVALCSSISSSIVSKF